jgi:hypothetical protein
MNMGARGAENILAILDFDFESERGFLFNDLEPRFTDCVRNNGWYFRGSRKFCCEVGILKRVVSAECGSPERKNCDRA